MLHLQRLRKCWSVPKDTKTLFTWTILLLFVCLCRAQTPSKKATDKRVFRATSIEMAPFLMVSRKGDGSTMKGMVVDILREMEKIMNVSFEIELVKDGQYGQLDENGNWTGMIGEVKSGYADVASAALTLTSARMMHVDMSYPYIKSSLKILIKKPELVKSRNSIFLVLQPFSTFVWVLVVVSCGVTGAALSIIGHFSPFEWTNTVAVQMSKEKRESFNWRNSFWYIITTFMWQGYRHFPRSYSGRILSIFWWMFSAFTLVLYIGCMASQLHSSLVPASELPFLTFKEMAHQREVTYGTLEQSSTFNYFKNSNQPLEQQIYKNMLLFRDNMASSTSEGVEKVRASNGRYAFIMEGSLAEHIINQHPCDLMMVGDDIFQSSYSFVTNYGSPLSKEINYALLRLQEMGTIQLIYKKWYHGHGECAMEIDQEISTNGRVYYDKERTPDSGSFRIVEFHLISGPLILLLIGIVLSGLVLAAEVYFAKEEAKRGSLPTEEGHRLSDNFENEN